MHHQPKAGVSCDEAPLLPAGDLYRLSEGPGQTISHLGMLSGRQPAVMPASPAVIHTNTETGETGRPTATAEQAAGRLWKEARYGMAILDSQLISELK